MGRAEMRAGDADRQLVADRLRQALDEGRLDLHEYDERLQRAYAAKTYGDLDGLVEDLPAAAPVPPAPAVPQVLAAPYHHATRRWLWNVWEEYLGVVGLVIGIWLIICLAAQDLVYFWPVWVAGPWGLVLIGQTVSGLGKGEPRRWVDRDERKRQEKAAKRERKAEQKGQREAERAAGQAPGPAAGQAGQAGDGPQAITREPAQAAPSADAFVAERGVQGRDRRPEAAD